MSRHRRLSLFLLVALLLTACAPAVTRPSAQDPLTPSPATAIFSPEDAPAADIPIAASADVGQFVWQTDGVYGYRMLRPAGWDIVDAGIARSFISPPGEGQTSPINLYVINLAARDWTDPWGPGDYRRAFEATGNIDAWAAALEQRDFRHIEKAPLPDDLARDAVVYLATAGPEPRLMPLAFKVSEGQPLMLALEGNVKAHDFDALKASGLWDDYLTILRSLTAIPLDAANVTPWAPTATPTATEPPRTPLPTSPPVTAGPRYEYTPPPVPVATPLDPRLLIWPDVDAFEQELSRAVLGPQLANRVCEWALLTGDTGPYYVWAVCMAYSGAPDVTAASVPAVITVDPRMNTVSVKVPRDGTYWAEDIRGLFPEDAQLKIFTHAIQPIIPAMEAHARLRLKWPGLPQLAAVAFEPPNPYGPGVSASVSLYSGQPDPTWTLTRLELARLDELLRDLPAGQCPAPFDGLGYRGVVVGLGGMGDAGNLRTTNGYVWSGDLGLNPGAFCFVDNTRSIERFLLSSALAHTNDPALRDLLTALGGPIPTPMITPSPTPTVAPGFVWWGDERIGVSLYLPDRWKLGTQTPLNRTWTTKVSSPEEAPHEPAPFWFTVLPPDYDNADADVRNFSEPELVALAWNTPVGGAFVSPYAPEGYNTYTRLPDTTVDGFPAAVVNNPTLSEAERGAQERRVLVKIGGLTVMFGTYYRTEDELRTFETALRSVKFDSILTLSGAVALTPQP